MIRLRQTLVSTSYFLWRYGDQSIQVPRRIQWK